MYASAFARGSRCWWSFKMMFALTCMILAAAASTSQQSVDVSSIESSQEHRLLEGTKITDATSNFVASTESLFDHMVVMDGTDNVSLHWNDISADNTIKGRLIHKADSIEQAPTWLSFGVYHSNHEYSALPTSDDSFMVGSSALIGMVSETAETESPVEHYLLADKMVDMIQETTDASVVSTTILQHDSDDGSVITELSFTKTVVGSPSSSTELRSDGTNIFLWAVGPPGGTLGVLGKHSFKGVIFLDFQNVKNQVQGTAANTEPLAEAGADTTETQASATTNEPVNVAASPTATPAVTDSQSNTQQELPVDDRPNTAPLVSAQCTSTIFGEGPGIGKVALTPTSTFSFQVMGEKVQLALEHSGSHAVWLSIASSPNGYMIGSSAIIGSPGEDDKAISPPRGYSLMAQEKSGIQENPNLSLEKGSIESITSEGGQETTTLKFTKLVNDPNDPVPILGTGQGTMATFLYAVGEGLELAYHEHRGQFRLDLSECGGSIATSEGARGNSDTAVWTRHGIFAAHGFFAALAWAFLSPFAITVAWFRTLVPASWIYIHVFANVFTAVLTIVAFALAVMGVAKQNGADHYSKTHHWVGTLLMAFVAFQVINGFLRPPVERKDPPPGSAPTSLPPQEIFLGIIPIPRTPREAWYTIHRMMGLAALAMGMYQMQSGLKLYAMRFQTSSIVNYYWMYVGIFIISLVVLKVYVIREEDRARQGVLQAVSTTEPTPEEEAQAESIGMNHTMA